MISLRKVERAKELRTTQRIQRVIDPWNHIRIFVQRFAVELSVVDTESPGAIFLTHK